MATRKIIYLALFVSILQSSCVSQSLNGWVGVRVNASCYDTLKIGNNKYTELYCESNYLERGNVMINHDTISLSSMVPIKDIPEVVRPSGDGDQLIMFRTKKYIHNAEGDLVCVSFYDHLYQYEETYDTSNDEGWIYKKLK